MSDLFLDLYLKFDVSWQWVLQRLNMMRILKLGEYSVMIDKL